MPRKHNARTKAGASKSSRRRRGRNSNGAAAGGSAAGKTKPPRNFFPDAGPGCHIATDVDVEIANGGGGTSSSSWIVGSERYDPDDYPPGVHIPDLALNPDENTVSVTNVHDAPRVCYVTIYEATVLDGRGAVLRSGWSTDNEGKTRVCTTLIVLCPPRTFVHMCRVDVASAGKSSLVDVEIDSDIQEWSRHPDPDDAHPYLLAFPFGPSGASTSASTGDGKSDDGEVADSSSAPVSDGYLCTQGVDGQLTHFLSGNHHAVDFRCDVGTPLLAVGDGTVVEVTDRNSLSGIAVGNLFTWNSVMIELDTNTTGCDEDGDGAGDVGSGEGSGCNIMMRGGPLFVEYVHIQQGSAVVRVGDRVSRGQVLCRSGSVGFSPEPHLHLAAYRDGSPTAPTVGVRFAVADNGCAGDDEGNTGGSRSHFVPRAGRYYDRKGLVNR